MGSIKAKLTDSFKAPKNTKAPAGRRGQMVFGPRGKSKPPKSFSVAPMYSMANQMLNAEARAEKQAALLPARTLKFEGRLNNAASIQGMLDELDLQADQLLSGLSTEEG